MRLKDVGNQSLSGKGPSDTWFDEAIIDNYRTTLYALAAVLEVGIIYKLLTALLGKRRGLRALRLLTLAAAAMQVVVWKKESPSTAGPNQPTAGYYPDF